MNSYDLNNYLNNKISEEKLNKFAKFYDILVTENEKYNLTSIIKEDEVYEKHFFDALSLYPLINNKMSIVDVGSGLGIPGLPLKIYDESLDITFLDSTKKKIDFIKLVSSNLSLSNKYILGRAEEVDEKFDCVIARGVASLNVLLELCVNLINENGILIAMKGSQYQTELNEASLAIDKLGYKLESINDYVLPIEQSHHVNLVFRKVKQHQNKYPRRYAEIKKNPL